MYEPSDDSFLLREAVIKYLKDNNPGKSLDMGTGSGIQAYAILEKSEYVLAADIDKNSIASLKKQIVEKGLSARMEAIVSDLFSEIPPRFEESFDLIVFNPPYLPKGEDDYEDSELYGGADGVHITRMFLEQARKFLALHGRIFFVASSLAKISLLEDFMVKTGYKFEVVSKKHISFEDILVYKAWLDD